MAQGAAPHAAATVRKAGFLALWGVVLPAAVWAVSFAVCVLIQRSVAPGLNPALAATLVVASFLAHAAILLDGDHVAEMFHAIR